MSQQTFDPSSKWLMKEHGAAILYLAGKTDVISCKALKAELVQPRKMPDGMLEAYLASKKHAHYLIEVATFAEERVVGQIADDIRLVRQTRGKLPEALVLVLSDRGNYRVPEFLDETSEEGWTRERLSWKVVELWRLSAEELLKAPNVGVVPWVPLTHYEGPPEVLLQRCRDRIEREGGKQLANLLAVTQVFAKIKFDRPDWLNILGGSKAMIESPLIQEITAEAARAAQVKSIQRVLLSRFKMLPPTIAAGLEQVQNPEGLDRLNDQVGTCKDLAAFEVAILKELPQPIPASTRGRRKSRKSAE